MAKFFLFDSNTVSSFKFFYILKHLGCKYFSVLFVIAIKIGEISRVTQFLRIFEVADRLGWHKVQQTCQKSSQQLAQRSLEFLEVHKVSERSVQINSGSCAISAKFGCSGVSSDAVLV